MSGEPIEPYAVPDTFVETMAPPEHNGGMVRLTFIVSRLERGVRESLVVSRAVMTEEAYQALRLALWSDPPHERDVRHARPAGSC
jgi:hypothetical protein